MPDALQYSMDISQTVVCDSRLAWRDWLEQHHQQKNEIWLILEKNAGVLYLEAVLEALCFGWIDSTAKKYSDTSLRKFNVFFVVDDLGFA